MFINFIKFRRAALLTGVSLLALACLFGRAYGEEIPDADVSASAGDEINTTSTDSAKLPAADAVPAVDSTDLTSEIPKIILAGLEAYTLTGAESAITAWVAGGPMEGDPSTASGADTFKNVEAHYGHYQDYLLIESKSLSSTTKLIYLQLNYEKGPLFARFLCYWNGSAWIVTGRMTFDIDPTAVLNNK